MSCTAIRRSAQVCGLPEKERGLGLCSTHLRHKSREKLVRRSLLGPDAAPEEEEEEIEAELDERQALLIERDELRAERDRLQAELVEERARVRQAEAERDAAGSELDEIARRVEKLQRWIDIKVRPAMAEKERDLERLSQLGDHVDTLVQLQKEGMLGTSLLSVQDAAASLLAKLLATELGHPELVEHVMRDPRAQTVFVPTCVARIQWRLRAPKDLPREFMHGVTRARKLGWVPLYVAVAARGGEKGGMIALDPKGLQVLPEEPATPP